MLQARSPSTLCFNTTKGTAHCLSHILRCKHNYQLMYYNCNTLFSSCFVYQLKHEHHQLHAARVLFCSEHRTILMLEPYSQDSVSITKHCNVVGDVYEVSTDWRLCNSLSIFVTVFTIKRPKGASEARARDLLIVKTVNKYTLNSLVSDLFCDRQRI